MSDMPTSRPSDSTGDPGYLALLTPLVNYKLDCVEAARRDL